MFSSDEMIVASPIIEGFKKILLEEDYNRCIEYVKTQKELRNIFDAHFDRSKKVRKIISQYKDEYIKSQDHYVLFNIIMLNRDEYCYQPWIELFEVFAQDSPLYSYKCLSIYHDLRERGLLPQEAGEVKADLFRKWETQKSLCKKNNLWIEAFGAALKQASISDDYLISFLTFLDYNLSNLISFNAEQQPHMTNLIEKIKGFLNSKLSNKKFSNWIQAILSEMHGDLDSSMSWRLQDYRRHNNPMAIVRKLYSIKEFDRLEQFLHDELELNPENSEIGKSLKRADMLKLAATIESEELVAMIEDIALKGPQVPSGERLDALYKAFKRYGLTKDGVKFFALLKQLFPLDHEVNKYYGRILEADGQIEEAFKNYDLMLMSGSDNKRTIIDIRMIFISALAQGRIEYGDKVMSKLDEMEDLKREIEEFLESGNKKSMEEIHKLYRRVKRELEMFRSLYEKIKESDKAMEFQQTFTSLCFKAQDYDCIGIVDDLICLESLDFIMYEEVKGLISITAVHSKKIFPLKFHIVNKFMDSIIHNSLQGKHILDIIEIINNDIFCALKFIYENQHINIEKIKEITRILGSQNGVNITLKTSMDILYKTQDDGIRKFLLLLLAALYNSTRLITSIYKSSYDKEFNKQLIMELCNLYIHDLNKNSHFHMRLGFDLMECSYIEEAKGYFYYAMNNIPEEENGSSVSLLMYCVCDLLMKMDRGLDINPDDYERKSYFAKALLSIVEKEKYKDYVSKYISFSQGKEDRTRIMIEAFRAALEQDYSKAMEELKKIEYDQQLFEDGKIQINSLSVKNNGYETEGNFPMDEVDVVATEKFRENEAGMIEDFLRIFDDIEDSSVFIEKLIQHVPVLADGIYGCQLPEEGLEEQYKVWTGIVDRYVGSIEALSILDLSNRCHASLKAAVAAIIMGRYNEFFKYIIEYCEAELQRQIKVKQRSNQQVAFAYEAHLIWYASYRYYRKHDLTLNKIEKELGYYHVCFFKTYTLIEDFYALMENMTYAKRMNLLFGRLGYRFITAYDIEYRDKNEGILSYFHSFAVALERYASVEDIEEKRIWINNAVKQIKKMNEIADKQFLKRYKYEAIKDFINNLLYVCNEELKKLENRPLIKAAFLNHEDLHTITVDNKFQCSFHFLITNEGQEKAWDLSCSFKVTKDNRLLSIPLNIENRTLREGEKLPVGFKHNFEEEGQYEIRIESKYAHGPFKTFNYGIDVRNKSFDFERIKENTYPTGPIDDESKFFGRKAIIQRIKDRLYDESDRTTFLIYGSRRVGKTSLLYHMEKIFGDKFYPIICDCENIFDADDTSELIYQLFVENIVDRLTFEYGIEIDMPLEEEFKKSPLRQLKRFFMDVEKSIGDKSLLLMVDEFDEVVKKVEDGVYSDELFNFIRTKMQHSNKTRFILAGGSYILNMMKNKALKISDTAKPLEIGFLELDEAREMILKPLGQKGIQCVPEAVDRIIMITSGHPYFLTAMGNSLVELLNREKERYVIYPDDVDYISDKLIDMTQKSMYEHFWNSLDSNYKKLIIAIIGEETDSWNDFVEIDRVYDRLKEVCAEGPLSEGLYKDKVRAIINELVAGKILFMENKVEPSVRISVEQLNKWTRRWKNTDQVLYEIQGGIESYEQ
ncbi:nSTAND1 domain-containing NTPase [Lutispora thermophila]|uniref:Predicted ATPase, AAA+ ATPase superfamily n=1 Tax=Lutispora thermophila DSM 19022 TaxID=1122184 RepID=A0A1M6EFE2_9FIRM|nr:ATP-binding protein [Lutispora thermophila]SHI84099.1 Predicted ATPase, AAA+ ATPase superfamily [Lutispora thermophila DSM 19022]